MSRDIDGVTRKETGMLRPGSSARPVRERQFVVVYLALCCLVLAHAVYVGYQEYFATIQSNHPGMTQAEYYQLHSTIAVSSDHPLFRGEDFAPDQYRVGVAFAAKWIADGLGLSKYYIVYAVFDFFCAFGIGLVCYRALIASEFFARLAEDERGLAVVLLLLGLAYPFAWTVPWERPETLPSSLYLLLCAGWMRQAGKDRWRLPVVYGATVWQSFVRTDIPMTLGISLMLLGAIDTRLRWKRIGAGVGMLGVAAAVQAYLQLILFRTAAYPSGVKMMHLAGNLQPRQLVVFVIALLPWALLMSLLVRYRKAMEAADRLAAIASSVYLPLWWAVGIVSEVRLFVPFLVALTPAAAKLMVVFLEAGGSNASVAGERIESA